MTSFLHLMPRIFLLCTKKLVCNQSSLALASNAYLVPWNPVLLLRILLLHFAHFQYGISLPKGMQFLTMAIRNLIHDLLPGGSNSTSASHVLLFFDIANMFNLLSQKSSRHELE
jgi:hypothetical protein